MLKRLFFLLFPVSVYAQTEIQLNDLSQFQKPSANWSIEGQIVGTPQGEALVTSPGKGILVNTLKAAKYQRTDDLVFALEHGDIRLSLDYMIPKGSNSGIYLQSRYEIQILDSWLKLRPSDGDAGAIYHRWDESRGTGKEGYEGHPPRQNAIKAPGLWNHIEIDFQAPKFDASGKKIANAKFVKITLNGVLLHENVELLGVTRGAISTQETSKAPLMIQGDHGQVAFKNIRYEVFDKPLVQMGTAAYTYYKGKLADLKVKDQKPEVTSTTKEPSMKLAEAKSDFLLRFDGTITIPEKDAYTFTTNWTGTGALLVDGDTITTGSHWYNEDVQGKRTLSAGAHKYTLYYAKDFGWGPKALGCFVERVGTHRQSITERTSLPEPEATPLVEITIDQEPKLQRSFVVYNDRKKTHAISVGLPGGLNFSYDLNQGGFLECWRGKFLDATQMWHDRGEPQTAAPMGVTVQSNGKFPLAFIASATANFPDSLNKTELKYKGYQLIKQENGVAYPVFTYTYNGLNIKDQTVPSNKNEGLVRRLQISGNAASSQPLYALLAEGEMIKNVGKNLYAINNQTYYVELLGETANQQAVVRQSNGKTQLLIPVSGLKEVSYQVTF
ncbi:DUF1080 domain-containing protein [Flectobacillus sp. DC10W]|uniref:DUF1080 domain-containing protein n=1 Tax=Flectobacillus longus TaxID=2984207 RepID=A0ABT6YNR7_9BACT|nr:family 16 glycoside hydrolase [Flectobacillus longus]MDI9865215.1 DUF1080 domain-containing protein [Flectobacillus longus]